MCVQYKELILRLDGPTLFEMVSEAAGNLYALITPKKKKQHSQPVEAIEVRHPHRTTPHHTTPHRLTNI